MVVSLALSVFAEVDKNSFAYKLAARAMSGPLPDEFVQKVEADLEMIELVLPSAADWLYHDPMFSSQALYVAGTGLYIFANGWGDCLSGCIEWEYWYFKVIDNAVIQLTAEEAAPLTEILLTYSPADPVVDTGDKLEFLVEIDFGKPFLSCYIGWEYSPTPGFEQPVMKQKQLYGNAFSIPFVRPEDEGFYRFFAEPYETGIRVFSKPCFLIVNQEPRPDPDETVEIPDPVLRQRILELLHLESGPIGRLEMEQLYEIGINDYAEWGDPMVESLEGLQYAVNLRTLYISDNMIHDLSPIAGLVNLERLNLGYKNLSVAWWLWPITDISPLSNLVNLEYLDLSINHISDLEPLRNLKKLRSLNLHGNWITSIEALEGLSFFSLDLGDNFIDFTIGQPAREVAMTLINGGAEFYPDINKFIHMYAEEFRIQAGGGSGILPHGTLEPSLNGILPMDDWVWVEEAPRGARESTFHVEQNMSQDSRDTKIMVFNRAFYVHQDGSQGPWQHLARIGPSLWQSSWFGIFSTSDSSWIWHQEHGWQFVIGDSEESLFIYDQGLSTWLWTCKSQYPFLYRFGENPGWLFYLENGSPGARWFLDGEGVWIREET